MEKKNEVLTTFLLIIIQFLLLKPSTIGNYHILNIIINLLAAIFTFLISYIYIKNPKKYPFSSMCLGYFLILFISTLINNGSIVFYLKTYITIWGSILLGEILIRRNPKIYLKNLVVFLEFMLGINLLSLLIFGNYNMWGVRVSFLGFDNAVVPFVILGNFIIMAANYLKNKKFTKETYIMTGITLFTVFLGDSSNAKAMAFLLIFFYVLWFIKLFDKKKFSKYINFRSYFYITLILFLAIVVFRLQFLFKDIIVNILHRNLTFTGRTRIWDTTISYIKHAPIIGYGIEDFKIRLAAKGIFHAHSTYLNILLEGGIIALIFYLNIFKQVWNKIKDNLNDKFVIILSYGMFLYMIMTIFEYYKQPHIFYILLILLFYSKELKKKEIKKNNNNILIVTSGFLPLPAVDGGAVESLVENILKYNEKSNDYKFVSYSVYSKNINADNIKKWHNVEYRYIKNNKIERVIFKIISKLFNKKIPDYFIFSVINDLKEKNEKYDIILVENMPLYAMYMKKFYGGKVILHVHNDWLNKNSLHGKEIIDSCDKIITASKYVANRISEIKDVDNIVPILNGIENDRFKKNNDAKKIKMIKDKYNIKDNEKVILFTGKLKKEKGALQVVKAFNNVNKKIKNIKLLIVGSSFNKDAKDTPYITSIKEIVNKNPNIIFTGFIDYQLISDIYSIADIQVVPSIIDESCPLVILEGMSAKLALIVTNSGGITELVDETCAFIYERNEDLVKNIENSLIKLLKNQKLLEQMQQSSYKKSKKFNNEKFCQAILSELKESE